MPVQTKNENYFLNKLGDNAKNVCSKYVDSPEDFVLLANNVARLREVIINESGESFYYGFLEELFKELTSDAYRKQYGDVVNKPLSYDKTLVMHMLDVSTDMRTILLAIRYSTIKGLNEKSCLVKDAFYPVTTALNHGYGALFEALLDKVYSINIARDVLAEISIQRNSPDRIRKYDLSVVNKYEKMAKNRLTQIFAMTYTGMLWIARSNATTAISLTAPGTRKPVSAKMLGAKNGNGCSTPMNSHGSNQVYNSALTA